MPAAGPQRQADAGDADRRQPARRQTHLEGLATLQPHPVEEVVTEEPALGQRPRDPPHLVGRHQAQVFRPHEETTRAVARVTGHDAQRRDASSALDDAREHLATTQEARDFGAGRQMVDLLRPADLEDPPVPHHRDQIGDAESLLLVVRHQERRGTGAFENRAHLLPDAVAQSRVEAREGLVEQDETRRRGESTGQRNALLLPPDSSSG